MKNEREPSPTDDVGPLRGKTFAFGLLFPGAAQAYAGRWKAAVAFLLAPWILMLLVVLLSLVVGLVGIFVPRVSVLGVPALLSVLRLVRPRKGIFFLLWVLSLAEGIRWANAERESPTGAVVSWKRPVLGLFLIPILFLPFVWSCIGIVGWISKLSIVAKQGVFHALGKTPP